MHSKDIMYVNFLQRSNEKIITASNDNTIKIWDMTSFKCIADIQNIHNSGFKSDIISLSPCGNYIAVAGPFNDLSFVTLNHPM